MSKEIHPIKNPDDPEFRKTLLDQYQVEKPEEVITFLGEDADLKNFLAGADKKILTYFPESSLYLDLFKDPTGEKGTHLVLAIATDLKSEVALEKFHTLITDWFSKVTPRVNGRISLDIECE